MQEYKNNIPEMKFRCLVAGGDGTVVWIIEECIKKNIDLQQLPIGIVPLGTGNDFSRTLGWGDKAENSFYNKKEFMDLVRNSYVHDVKAVVKPFDLWEVEVITNESTGLFEKVKDKKITKIMEDQKVVEEEEKMDYK